MNASRPKRSGGARLSVDSRTIAEWEALLERMRMLLEGERAKRIVCDVGALGHPDVGAAGALARLQLEATRCGTRIELRGASAELRGLLDLIGLAAVVPCADRSVVEPVGEAEQREPARGVEEEDDAADLPA